MRIVMAGDTVGRDAGVVAVNVAGSAGDAGVRPGQRKGRFGVVNSGAGPVSGAVAGGAVCAVAAVVDIVNFVA